MGHKHPEYEYLYEWADKLNIEEWRVDSMIDRVGKDKEKLRRQKKLPWLYKKGRKKYRLFIGWWMELEGFLEESQYVLDWKPKKDRDKPPKKEERINGYSIVFQYADALMPLNTDVRRLNVQRILIHVSQKDLWKDPRNIRALFLVELVRNHFVHSLNLPLLGGRVDWDDESWYTLAELGDRLKDKGVYFPDSDEKFEYHNDNYVSLSKSWTKAEWQTLEDEGPAFGVLALKQQITWPDEDTYLKCPWTWDQIEDWKKKDFRQYEGRQRISDDEVMYSLNEYYRLGFHIVKWWSVKYCKPDDNEIARWIQNNREDYRKPHELYEKFREWFNSKLEELEETGWHLFSPGIKPVRARLGVALPVPFMDALKYSQEEQWKIQHATYFSELENRNPMHLAFNPCYQKYIKKRVRIGKEEFTGFGDIRFVTDIPSDEDGLKQARKAMLKERMNVKIRTFQDTTELIQEIQTLEDLLSNDKSSEKQPFAVGTNW